MTQAFYQIHQKQSSQEILSNSVLKIPDFTYTGPTESFKFYEKKRL